MSFDRKKYLFLHNFSPFYKPNLFNSPTYLTYREQNGRPRARQMYAVRRMCCRMPYRLHHSLRGMDGYQSGGLHQLRCLRQTLSRRCHGDSKSKGLIFRKKSHRIHTFSFMKLVCGENGEIKGIRGEKNNQTSPGNFIRRKFG